MAWSLSWNAERCVKGDCSGGSATVSMARAFLRREFAGLKCSNEQVQAASVTANYEGSRNVD